MKSVLIGNGLTDGIAMVTTYYDQACTAGNTLGKPVLDIKTCITMQQEVKRCEVMLEKVCRTQLVFFSFFVFLFRLASNFLSFLVLSNQNVI